MCYECTVMMWLIIEKFQDIENGGISDRPDDACDAYHTYFGVAGIKLLWICLVVLLNNIVNFSQGF